jgi:7-cyano-7-deazaguanine synthase in queuosine biosynthesis
MGLYKNSKSDFGAEPITTAVAWNYLKRNLESMSETGFSGSYFEGYTDCAKEVLRLMQKAESEQTLKHKSD